MNKLEDFAGIFAGVRQWAGKVPQGFVVDFLGALQDVTFWQDWNLDPNSIGGRYIETTLPRLEARSQPSVHVFDWSGEHWFEAVDWFAAARAARDRFVMITLGAWGGAQAVGSYRALRQVSPMPCTLVAVEPVLENVTIVSRHFRNNGIDPEAHWIVPLAVSDSTDSVFFPVAPRGMGPQNCFSTSEKAARENYLRDILASGKTAEAVADLLLRNSTGLRVAGTQAGDRPAGPKSST